MERQGHHTSEVVQIQTGTLRALPGAEREEFTKHFAVHDDTRHQGRKHHQCSQAHNPDAQIFPLQLQAVMHGVKPVAANFQFVIRQHRAGSGIQSHILVNVIVVFRVLGQGHTIPYARRQYGVAVSYIGPILIHRQFGAWGHFALCWVVQPWHVGGVIHFIGFKPLQSRQKHFVEGRHGLSVEPRFRNGPTVDLSIENRQGAKEKTDHQHKAQHQTEPGVHPSHGQTEIIQHPNTPSRQHVLLDQPSG